MRAIAWPLAAVVALTAPAADAQSIDGLADSRFVEQSERFTPDGGVPIDLRFLVAREAAGQTARVVNTTHAALTMLSAWFGPLASGSLTVAGVPWRDAIAGDARPGLVSAPLRWLSPVRDRSTERALVSALVRQYWSRAVTQDPAASFEEAVILYIAARAVHQLLEVSNFQTTRFFGGVVPWPLRWVLLSPPAADPRPRVWKFDELQPAVDDDVRRAVKALQTLERYVGWPTLLEAISRMRLAVERYDAAALITALSDVRGTNMRPLVMECLRADAVFDYSLEGLTSMPGAAGLTETTVTITRRGNGRFAVHHEGGDSDRTMPVLVRFADGTEVRDVFDGAAPSVTLVYSTKAAAVSAAIDPEVMLLLDVNRQNNAIVRDAPLAPLGLRLALHWMAWLQNAMLTYTSLV